MLISSNCADRRCEWSKGRQRGSREESLPVRPDQRLLGRFAQKLEPTGERTTAGSSAIQGFGQFAVVGPGAILLVFPSNNGMVELPPTALLVQDALLRTDCVSCS